MTKEDEQKKLETLRLKEQLHENEHGWICHLVDDPNRGHGGSVNYHTHKLAENYGHPDLQITLPLRPETAYSIFSAVAEWIKQGNKYEAGKQYDGLLSDGQKVAFARAIDDSGDEQREVLRLILPDKDGSLERWETYHNGNVYQLQWQGAFQFEFQKVAWENHWTQEYAKGFVDARARSHGELPPEDDSWAREDDYGCGYKAGYRCHGRSLIEGLE